jgi:hypothetical protein
MNDIYSVLPVMNRLIEAEAHASIGFLSKNDMSSRKKIKRF